MADLRERALDLIGACLPLGKGSLECTGGGTLPTRSDESLNLAHGLAVLGLNLGRRGGELRCRRRQLLGRHLDKGHEAPLCDCEVEALLSRATIMEDCSAC